MDALVIHHSMHTCSDHFIMALHILIQCYLHRWGGGGGGREGDCSCTHVSVSLLAV